jgi:chromosomal replication initiation ATPase DnaA
MKHFTNDFEIRASTVRTMVKQTFESYQLALAVAKEAGLLDEPDMKPHTEERKLPKMAYPDAMLGVITNYFGLDLARKTNKRVYVDARHTACYLLRKYTRLSFSEIGKFFSIDHSTVITAKNKIQDLLDTHDLSTRRNVEALCGLIESQFDVASRDIQMNGATQGTGIKVLEDDSIKLKIA